MNRICVLALVAALLMVSALVAQASPEAVGSFAGKDFSSFATTGYCTELLAESYNYGNTFTGVITSQAYKLTNGDYLYLYQAKNTGPSVMELLGVSSVYDVKEFGYLTGGQPTNFALGGRNPYQAFDGSYAVTYDEDAGGLLTYGYYGFMHAQVSPGDHTTTLYAVSSWTPTVGDAFAIDHGTAAVRAWTAGTAPVPEPSSLLALGMGVVPFLVRRRFKK